VGLTVQLRPYQQQSLDFMLEAERRPGGFRDQFWMQLTNSKQQSYWWSPVFRRMCKVSFGTAVVLPSQLCTSTHTFDPPPMFQDVPSMPRGGWLAEETGLGKTVEVLGLVLANKPPPDTLLVSGQKDSGGYVMSHATLVVCAVDRIGGCWCWRWCWC
jgi:SWI/SNF-related matrix-associated actin-dependent regulator of chromatin subfamily A3